MTKSRYKRPKQHSIWKYTQKTFIVVGLLLFIGILIRGIVITFQRKYAIEKEKQELSQQVSRIKQDIFSLEQVKEYISSSSYQEREAKQKLDLQKPGEQVVIITPGSIVANLNSEELVSVLKNPEAEKRIPAQTNPEKWWAYFFDKERLP
jgi:cytoskeletal protein RodZ